jgi:hypothetical protein
MKLRTLFTVDAIVSLLLALGLLLGPPTILKFFGLTTGKTELLLAQILGAALAGFAALAWMGRGLEDPSGAGAATVGLFTFSSVGFVVALLGVMAQVTRAGGAWVLVLLFLLSAVGYGYFLSTSNRE